MPRNKIGGKKAKAKANKHDGSEHIIEKLPSLEKLQQFAELISNKGDCRFEARLWTVKQECVMYLEVLEKKYGSKQGILFCRLPEVSSH